jgi:hypothetical protein
LRDRVIRFATDDFGEDGHQSPVLRMVDVEQDGDRLVVGNDAGDPSRPGRATAT